MAVRPDETMGVECQIDGEMLQSGLFVFVPCLSGKSVTSFQGQQAGCFSGHVRQSPLGPPPLADRSPPYSPETCTVDVNVVDVVSCLHTYTRTLRVSPGCPALAYTKPQWRVSQLPVYSTRQLTWSALRPTWPGQVVTRRRPQYHQRQRRSTSAPSFNN